MVMRGDGMGVVGRRWMLVMLALVAFPAQATLMQRDLTSPGDALLTFDPATSIEWLDLPPTLRKSVDDVEAGFGSYASQGFTVPMVDDVLGFFEGIAPFRLTTESETVEKYVFLDAGQAFEVDPVDHVKASSEILLRRSLGPVSCGRKDTTISVSKGARSATSKGGRVDSKYSDRTTLWVSRIRHCAFPILNMPQFTARLRFCCHPGHRDSNGGSDLWYMPQR